MKRVLLLLLALSLSAMAFATEYDVVNFYEKKSLPSGAKVLDSYNNVEDAETILVETKMNAGKYVVKLRRLDTNFYEVIDTDIVIETRYCNEYASYKEVVLIIEGYGWKKGKVVF